MKVNNYKQLLVYVGFVILVVIGMKLLGFTFHFRFSKMIEGLENKEQEENRKKELNAFWEQLIDEQKKKFEDTYQTAPFLETEQFIKLSDQTQINEYKSLVKNHVQKLINIKEFLLLEKLKKLPLYPNDGMNGDIKLALEEIETLKKVLNSLNSGKGMGSSIVNMGSKKDEGNNEEDGDGGFF